MRKLLTCLVVFVLVFSSFSIAFAGESYTVKDGDVLWKIAKQYGLTYEELAEYNNLENVHLIYIGQKLNLPDKIVTTPKPVTPVDTTKNADVVLQNGKIYTIDSDNTILEAVAVKDGKIIAVGSTKEIEKYIGSNTNVINLEGNTVFPGMIDSHLHPPGTALAMLFSIDLNGLTTKDATLKAIKEFIEKNPDLDIYFGGGFSMGMAGDSKGPKKEWLDEICADKPIILTSNDGHNKWLNSKALEELNITKETVPEFGNIHKDPATGEIWGTLTDVKGIEIPEQEYTKEQQQEAMKLFQETLHSWGYTGILALSTAPFEDFYELEKKGELNLRVNGAVRISPEDNIDEKLAEMNDLKKKYETDLIKVSTAKFFADGVVEGSTGFLLEPYREEAGQGDNHYGDFYWDTKELGKIFTKTLEEGYQIHVHSIGDASTRLVLDALETAQKTVGEKDYRNTITHLQLVNPTDIERFAELNIIASVQPYWHFKEPDWWEYVDSVILGEERATNEYPLQSFFSIGVTVAGSSDHYVTPIADPFWAIEAGVTRNLNNPEFYGVEDIPNMDDPTWLLNKNERASLDNMIKAYTINNAYTMFRENSVGSIEVGKWADMIVVTQDPFQVDPIRIDSTKVLKTIFNGKIVYEAK